MHHSVWYITKYFSPKTETSMGGRSWFLLSELAASGVDVTIISSDSNNLVDLPYLQDRVFVEEVQGVRIVWLKTLKYSVAKSVKRILSWFHFEYNLVVMSKDNLPKPDVIVVSSLSLLTIFNGLYLKRKYRCRFILEIRDIWPLTIVEEGGFSELNPFIKFLSFIEKLGYRYADLIIGTMPNLKKHVSQVSATKTEVVCVPMGVSESQINQYSLVDADYLKRYLSSPKFKVVYAGTVGITNALETFFEAAKQLEDETSVEFLLVGEGALLSYFKNRYGDLPNLKFAPKVPRHSVQAVLAECDLVYFSVFPSKVWEYGQSLNKIVDYMLSGKPVIGSYSGYPTMINEADCGVYVPPGDALALANQILRFSKMPRMQLEEIGGRGRSWLIKNRNYRVLSADFAKAIFKDYEKNI